MPITACSIDKYYSLPMAELLTANSRGDQPRVCSSLTSAVLVHVRGDCLLADKAPPFCLFIS